MIDLASKIENGCRIYTAYQDGYVLGYVAIDSMVGGRSCGGLRMLPDIGEEEIQDLARAMTLKFGFLGLPQGGAKAGVLADPEGPQAQRLKKLIEFGRAIIDLLRTRTFIPSPDMGTRSEDIRLMLKSLGVPVAHRELRSNSSGNYTALSVWTGILQCVRHLGLNLSRCRVAIEGFGNVGRPLARLLMNAGVKIIAISTSLGALYHPRGLDMERLLQGAEESGSHVIETHLGAERLERAKLLELPVDILCPCARHHSIHMGNASRISARAICPGANNPTTPEAEHLLFKKGVICLPDFVSNCGGVLGGTMEFASLQRERIAAFINRRLGDRMAWLLRESERRQVLPRDLAASLAYHRFSQIQQEAAHPSLSRRFLEIGLKFYRNGWIPGPLVAPLSLAYFQKVVVKVPYLIDDEPGVM